MEFKCINFNETLLHQACISGDMDLVIYLISLNNMNIKPTTIFNYYFYKVYKKHIKFMEFQKKVNIYYTILHLACKSGNCDLVKYLILLDIIDITSKTILLI